MLKFKKVNIKCVKNEMNHDKKLEIVDKGSKIAYKDFQAIFCEDANGRRKL